MIGQRNLAPRRDRSVWARSRPWQSNGRLVSGVGGGVMAAAGAAVAVVGTAMLVRAVRGQRVGSSPVPSLASDPVGRESDASFPASDPPSWTLGVGASPAEAPAIWESKEALSGGGGVHVEERIEIGRPVHEVYRFWRHLPNLPRFMQHLQSVTTAGGDARRSHWVARAPLGTTVEWDAEIINEVENRVIGWRSLDDADVVSAGSVNFAPTDRNGTEVRVKLQYAPPAGRLGAVVARWFGEEPSQQISDDLRSLKRMLEAAPGLSAGRAR